MTFLRITEAHPYLERIQLWYEASFTVDERRHFDELITLLAYPDMYLCALLNDYQLVGFSTYWQWKDVLFIEHFAIDPEQRGKQFGQQALVQLLRIKCRYCILEVERPHDEISQRRVHFYERQGFTLNTFDYVQPPYQPHKAAIPMWLMSVPAIPDQETFNTLSLLIKKQVYKRFYT